MNGYVQDIYICPKKGGPMQAVREVEAIGGFGLKGDRYAAASGSWNKGEFGKRQVTLINGIFFEGSGFTFADSRRNIITYNVELMWLIGREFVIGSAIFRGVKYCDPCSRPSRLSGNPRDFAVAFSDRGGLVAEIIQDGIIRVRDPIIPPPKNY